MSCKRKRSVDDSPLSVSSYAWSTPEAQSPAPFPQSLDGSVQMELDASSRHNAWDFSNASRVKSSDWGNRTRKRVRDNRPDERAIHENTLQKLFSAQRTRPDASPVSTSNAPKQQQMLALSKPQKSTLHAFWKQLPAPPVQPIFSRPQQLDEQLPRCDDCDASLQCTNDSMDVDMDPVMACAVERGPFACTDCGKNVCSACAVVSARRHCLQCATDNRNPACWW
ncbi:hypothetical protein ACEQ8H_007138 [Pleosporales sp. CAS-2024a]